MVLSSYRRDDFADPDGYLVQLCMVLERYDDSIIRDATSPTTGIQRTCKFPPSIAEFVEFCDELKRRATYADQWDERSRKQLEERERFENEAKAEPLEYRKQVVDRLWPKRNDSPKQNFMRNFTVANAEAILDRAARASTAGADGARAGATDRSPPGAPNDEQVEETFQRASPPLTW